MFQSLYPKGIHLNYSLLGLFSFGRLLIRANSLSEFSQYNHVCIHSIVISAILYCVALLSAIISLGFVSRHQLLLLSV